MLGGKFISSIEVPLFKGFFVPPLEPLSTLETENRDLGVVISLIVIVGGEGDLEGGADEAFIVMVGVPARELCSEAGSSFGIIFCSVLM